MSQLKLLTQKISKHFNLHPSKQKTLNAMIFGAIQAGNVHHSALARYVESPNPKAATRRVERFFLKPHLIPKNMLNQS